MLQIIAKVLIHYTWKTASLNILNTYFMMKKVKWEPLFENVIVVIYLFDAWAFDKFWWTVCGNIDYLSNKYSSSSSVMNENIFS